jgi:2-hydroxychromene-2-carboxylate isomerase
VRIDWPPAHPFNPLPALRVAALDLDHDARWRVIHALYDASWGGGGQAIDTHDRVASVLTGAGLDGALLVARANEPDAKERLRKNTDEALSRGAFGVPTMFLDGEMFFGFDSFAAIEAWARGEDPVAAQAALVERWAKLPAAATRPNAAR